MASVQKYWYNVHAYQKKNIFIVFSIQVLSINSLITG